MVTKEDLKQEIEQLDSAYLELAFKLLQQFPHSAKTKPDALSRSRAIDYSNQNENNELAFSDVIDAASFGKQLRTDSWQRNNG